MRTVRFIALLGTGLSMTLAQAQNASDQAPSGTPESHQKHSRHSLFEGPPPKNSGTPHHIAAENASEPASAKPATPPPPAPAPNVPTVQAVPPGPPQKNLTGEEFGLIRVGS